MGSGGAYVLARARWGCTVVHGSGMDSTVPACRGGIHAGTPAAAKPAARSDVHGASVREHPGTATSTSRARTMGVYGRARSRGGLHSARLPRQRPRRGGHPRPAISTSRVHAMGVYGRARFPGYLRQACLPRQRPGRGASPTNFYVSRARAVAVRFGNDSPPPQAATRSQAYPCRATRVNVGDAVKLVREKVGKTGLRRATRRGSWKVAAGDRVLPCHDTWGSRGRARPATSTMASSFSTTSGSTAARSTTDTSRW